MSTILSAPGISSVAVRNAETELTVLDILVKLMQIAVPIISHAAPESAQRKAASIFLIHPLILNT